MMDGGVSARIQHRFLGRAVLRRWAAGELAPLWERPALILMRRLALLKPEPGGNSPVAVG